MGGTVRARVRVTLWADGCCTRSRYIDALTHARAQKRIRTHAHAHARTHARTHARARARIHTHNGQVLYPDHMHLNRGNHETVNMNKMYGFEVRLGYATRICDSDMRLGYAARICAAGRKTRYPCTAARRGFPQSSTSSPARAQQSSTSSLQYRRAEQSSTSSPARAQQSRARAQQSAEQSSTSSLRHRRSSAPHRARCLCCSARRAAQAACSRRAAEQHKQPIPACTLQSSTSSLQRRQPESAAGQGEVVHKYVREMVLL